MAEFAWRDGFVPAFVACPHTHDDPDGEGYARGQREHLQLLIALFAKQVGERAVAVGLYPDLNAFFSHGEPAGDLATAEVDRAGGAT